MVVTLVVMFYPGFEVELIYKNGIVPYFLGIQHSILVYFDVQIVRCLMTIRPINISIISHSSLYHVCAFIENT